MIAAAAAAVLAAVAVTSYIERRRRRRMYREAEMILDSFRGVTGSVPETEDPGCEISDRDADRIKRQLRRIREMLSTVRERSRMEREETKSVVTDIAHQLKTPVAVMEMSMELLADDSLDGAEREEFMARAAGSLEELKNLVDSLVQISRMETGLIELRPEKTPAGDTIRKAVSCIIGKAEAKKITIEMNDPDEAAERPLHHDSRWLAEALINVLDNAIKYSPEGTTVTISVTGRSSFLRIETEDRGIGIPKDEYNKVMRRFYRGSNARGLSAGGSGVGLYLVNRIVRMHGGMVSVKPGHGRPDGYPGTIIVIQIPY